MYERNASSSICRLFRAAPDSRVVAIDCPGADAILELTRAAGVFPRTVARREPSVVAHATGDYVAAKIGGHAHGYKADTLLQWSGVAGKTRTISTCHTWYSDSWRMKFYEWLDKRSLRRFDHVVVVSPQLQREVLDCGVAPQRVSLIRNGTAAPMPSVDARQRIRREFSFADDDFAMIRVGW